MGSVACCGSDSDSDCQQKVGHPCNCSIADEQAGWAELNEEEEEEIDLERLPSEDELEGVDTLGDALHELRKAMQQYREGRCEEAAKSLAAAEALIEKAPDSPARKSIKAVCQKNRDFKELRETTPEFEDLRHGFKEEPVLNKSRSDSAGVDSTGVGESSPGVTVASADEEPEPAVEEQDEEKELYQLMEDMDAALTKVRDFCRRGMVFEAHVALEELEALRETAPVARLGSEQPDSSPMKFLLILDHKLKMDPMLVKLRSVHKRMTAAVNMLQTPVKAGKGVNLELKDPQIGDDFRLEMSIRFAEGAEREKNGPATQLILQCSLFNFPAPLLRLTAADCESDLMRKEWIKDASVLAGKPGRPGRLYCAQVHTTMSPSMLPIKLDDVIFREFAVCTGEGKLPNIGPGVLVIEYRAPVGDKEFEGMGIPGKKSSTVRITDGRTCFYKTQSKNPTRSNVQVVATVGLPVPQMILPLSLLKSFAADALRESFKRLKIGLFDNWDALEHQSRIEANPDFYGEVAGIPPDELSL